MISLSCIKHVKKWILILLVGQLRPRKWHYCAVYVKSVRFGRECKQSKSNIFLICHILWHFQDGRHWPLEFHMGQKLKHASISLKIVSNWLSCHKDSKNSFSPTSFFYFFFFYIFFYFFFLSPFSPTAFLFLLLLFPLFFFYFFFYFFSTFSSFLPLFFFYFLSSSSSANSSQRHHERND